MFNIYTIGVYNSTEDLFFDKLISNKIDLFCDIRQRRGVRGSMYKYVNSNYLQSRLKELGISYKYIKGLAPTNEIRQKQKDADKLQNVTKKSRNVLGEVFCFEYHSQILSKFDMEELMNEINGLGVKNVAFFCVEQVASACHRSLVANKIAKMYNLAVTNL